MRPGYFGPGSPWYGAYPHAFIYHGARCRFFPRLFWFALGAGVFAAWSRHQETERRIAADGQGPAGHNGEWRHWSGTHFGGCTRRREWQQQQQLQQQQQSQQHWNTPQTYQQPVVAPAVIPAATASTPVTPAPTPAAPQSPGPTYPANTTVPESTEWHADRIREATKQASDTMADMSENALDALMSNLQALKAKITAAREARERREKERLNPPQYRSDKDQPDRLV